MQYCTETVLETNKTITSKAGKLLTLFNGKCLEKPPSCVYYWNIMNYEHFYFCALVKKSAL